MASPVIHHDFIDGTNKGTGGSAYDIQNTGSLTFDTTNKVSGTSSVSLTGASANAGDCPQFPFNTGVNGLHTMSFWMKMTETSVLRYLFTTTTSSTDTIHNNSDTLRTFVTGSWDSTANIRFGIWSALNNGNYLETFVSPPYNDFSTTGYCDGKWHHFVMVSNNSGAANSYDLYLDNVLAATNMGVNSSNGADRFMFLGGCPWSGSTLGNNQGITGNVDDFRFYDYALSSSEISSLYNEIAVQFLQPVIRYTFDTDGTNSGTLGSSNDAIIPTSISSNSDPTTIDTTQKLLGNASIKVGTYAVNADAMPKFYFNTGTAWSISFWARHNHDSSRLGTGEQPRRALTNITKNPANTGHGERWEFSSTATGDLVCKRGSGGTTFKTGIHSHIFSDEKWHHYVISVSSNTSDSGCKFYVDNTVVPLPDNSTTEFPIFMEDNTEYLFILGGNHYANKPQGGSTDEAGIDGNFDEVKVYDYALDSTAIIGLYVSDLISSGLNAAELLAAGLSVAELLAAGLSFAELLAGDVIPDWALDTDANHLAQSYVKDFIDISGSLVLRENSSLTVNGNIETKGNITIKYPIMEADLSLNHNMIVSGDISMNGNVTVGDVSMNGKVLDCSFTDSSIPESAFNGQIGPDYTQPTILYEKGFDTTADVSMNANVQINNLKVDGDIEFSDGTTMNTYDDNIEINYNQSKQPGDYFDATVGGTLNPNIAGSTHGDQLFCSSNGQYAGIGFGGSAETNSGMFITRDFGANWTHSHLPSPADGTPLYAPHDAFNMSYDGKYIVSGVTANDGSNDEVIGLSEDYGDTWTTYYTSSHLGVSNTYNKISAIAVNHDASLIVFAWKNNNVGTMYYSTDKMASWADSGADIEGQMSYTTKIVNNVVFIGVHDVKNFKAYRIENGVVTYLGSSFGGTPSYSCLGAFSMGGPDSADIAFFASRQSNLLEKATDINTTPVITNVSSVVNTLNYSTLGVVMSPSGKYVLIGENIGSIRPTLKTNKSCYLSTDSGETFSTISSNFFNHSDLRSIAISDAGHFYGMDTSNKRIYFASYSSFKASTFTSLTINNTLTAGSFSTSSDYRIKTDISQLDETVTLDNLRPVKYLQTLINKPQYGLIAHELQEYYPDLVVGEKDGKEWQRVNYTGLIALLINEIKQLKRELTELENGM